MGFGTGMISLILMIAVLFVAAKVLEKAEDALTTRYLHGKRTELLKESIPECQYEPEGSINGEDVMLLYGPGNRYYRSLGYMTFWGRYKSVHIDDAIMKDVSENSDVSDDYYECLLFEYQIPSVSPVYQSGDMTVRRKGRIAAAADKFATFSKSRTLNMFGSSKNGRNTIYTFADSRLEASITNGICQEKWMELFQRGLAEMIEELFDDYKDVAQIKLCFRGDKLRLCVSNRIRDTYLMKSNDFVVQNIGRICRTITLMVEMCIDDFGFGTRSKENF